VDNPALFAGHSKTPIVCLKDWFEISDELDVPQTLFQRHTAFMSRYLLNKAQRSEFNQYTNRSDITNYLSTLFDF